MWIYPRSSLWIDNLFGEVAHFHWLVSGWCGCSKILLVSEEVLLIMYVVRVLNLNGMLGFYSFLRVFNSVHVIGSWHMQFARCVWVSLNHMGYCFPK